MFDFREYLRVHLGEVLVTFVLQRYLLVAERPRLVPGSAQSAKSNPRKHFSGADWTEKWFLVLDLRCSNYRGPHLRLDVFLHVRVEVPLTSHAVSVPRSAEQTVPCTLSVPHVTGQIIRYVSTARRTPGAMSVRNAERRGGRWQHTRRQYGADSSIPDHTRRQYGADSSIPDVSTAHRQAGPWADRVGARGQMGWVTMSTCSALCAAASAMRFWYPHTLRQYRCTLVASYAVLGGQVSTAQRRAI
eukprot:3941920-Rhodomonas_salina.4